ncbi:MAG: phosphoribosylformylglycinamidine cyclo-ligase [Planctomycetes bacterium]|nr:phosphoribosylformylglycinamidine cyclo-ligase [Planctomycetota bacterium]NUQ35243.1 phosphoribosylformylglycinamidine cyclo-ligase [Planctomycetaceae bacterium]
MAKSKAQKAKKSLDYRTAGVDIDAGNRFVDFVFKHVKGTYSDRVVELEDGYAGLFTLEKGKRYKRNYNRPVLVACTDSVGSKVKLAFALGIHDTVGIDCVAMNVNDMICVGARPLFFIDYIGISAVKGDVCNKLLLGVIEGCRQSECALLGGETCEMPDIYAKGEYDLVGFAVGVVESGSVIDGKRVKPGDVVIGLPSSGVHSNGFTLARKALFDRAGYTPRTKMKELGGQILGKVMLTPTRIYVRSIMKLLDDCGDAVHALAHITGGGLVENVPRVLPKGCRAVLNSASWPRPRIFDLIQRAGNVNEKEMYRVFNMGIGMVVVVDRKHQTKALKSLRAAGEKPHVIGEIVKGTVAAEIR